MNFVSRQAEEAILNPAVPESYKDYVLEAAVGTILKIAERRSAYKLRRKEGRGIKRSHTMYKAK